MKILQNISEVSKAAIDDDKIGEQLKLLAVEAMIGGIDSTDWERYMRIFADNTEQLNRLRGINQPDTWDRVSVAYLVSNAVCGGLSTGALRQNVEATLDDGLSAAPELNFIKTDLKNL